MLHDDHNRLMKPHKSKDQVSFALITSSSRGMRISATNLAAETMGVAAGMPIADARALCPDLVTENATPDADKVSLARLALWCLRYSPLATTHALDGLALDITGCAHLFGGEQEMLTDISSRMRQFHLTARLATAETIGAAWAAARYSPDPITRVEEGSVNAFLAPLPLSALRLNDDTTRRLGQLGLRKVGSILDMPKAPLISRFGARLIERLNQATGKSAEVFGPLIPPPVFHLRYPFVEPVVQLEAVDIALEILAGKMADNLQEVRKGARCLELRLFRIDGHMERMRIRTSRLCHEGAHITLLFREALSRLGTDLDRGYGFDLITLTALDVEETDDVQLKWSAELAENQRVSSPDLSQLLDRFGNRFGFDKITRFIPAESHLPERAFRRSSAHRNNPVLQWREKAGNSPSRPLLIFKPVEPITVLAEVPDGPPLRFQWRRQQHDIIAAEGPERVAPEWWRRHAEKGFPQTRDYYRVEDNKGYRFWLYRDGLYSRKQDNPRWYLHGLFS